MKTKELIGLIIVLILFIAAAYFSQQYNDVIKKELVQLGGIAGMVFYALGGAVTTAVPPLTILPFLPLAVSLWGSLATALLSIFGWTAGAIVAFTIARKFGHPVVQKLVNLEKLERLQNLMPQENIFWSIVLVRIALPVDILSYAIGLFTQIRFSTYISATIVGITPFAFVFAYLSKIPVGFQIAAFALGLLIIYFGYTRIKGKLKKNKSNS